MRDESVQRIMTTGPVTIGVQERASKARKMFDSGQMHHLPVVDGDTLVGILTSADLLKLYLLDEASDSRVDVAVEKVMQADPITLSADATLRDAAEKLSGGGFHSLPVIDADRRLVGIVTSTDLIEHLLKSIPTGDGTLTEESPQTLMTRVNVLEQVYKAAELYERSGHAEREHALLLKALEAARSDSETVTI